MTVASIASAAVVSGELIIGLADGRIIRAGYVQGPTGKTGPEGAMGSTGPRGADGNTILHGMEKPQGSDGKDGDFYIWTREWFIYGPKTSGQWGTGTNMLAPKEYFKSNPNQSGGGGTAPSNEGGGGSGSVFSNQVFLSGTGRAISAPGGNIIPEGLNLSVQSNLNKWIENSLRALDTKLPVAIVDPLPGTGQYEGDLVLFEGSLYIWAGGAWTKVSADGGATIGTIPPTPAEEGQLWFCNNEDDLTLYIYDGADWVPAAPPVSLDGIEASIANVDAELMKVNANIAMNKRDIDEAMLDVQEDQAKQDERLDAIEAQDYASTTEDNTFTGNNEFTNNLVLPKLPSENTHATNKFYTDAQDTILHGMVDVIVGRRVYSKYQLQKDDKSLRSGKFKLLILPQHDSTISQADAWEDVNYIYFSYDDYDGHRRSLTELKVGDQLSMESSNSAATFTINQTKVNGLDNFFGVTRISFFGDPSRPHVFQMVAGDEGRITAEEVGEIVLNRFNAVDAVRNSYGKIFTGVQSYDPNNTLAPGTIAWDGGSDMYISDIDSNNFSWCSNTNATFTLDSKQYFTIYGETSSGQIGSMHMRGSFTTFFKSSKHVKLGGIEKLHGSNLLYNNKWYIVNLGGFM